MEPSVGFPGQEIGLQLGESTFGKNPSASGAVPLGF